MQINEDYKDDVTYCASINDNKLKQFWHSIKNIASVIKINYFRKILIGNLFSKNKNSSST